MLSRLLSHVRDGDPEPIRPGHRYRSEITGDAFIVQSVQPTTPIEFVNDRGRPSSQSSVRKDTLRAAIEHDIVVHDEQRCGQCR